jgi:hypothetical protein
MRNKQKLSKRYIGAQIIVEWNNNVQMILCHRFCPFVHFTSSLDYEQWLEIWFLGYNNKEGEFEKNGLKNLHWCLILWSRKIFKDLNFEKKNIKQAMNVIK